MAGVELKSTAFRREREGTWRELERLVGKSEKGGLRSLTATELFRLPKLYRASLSSLSVARAISLDRNVVGYLESLAARAYFCVYGARAGVAAGIAAFFRFGFPAAVRAARWHIGAAALCMGLGVFTGFILTLGEPDWYYALVPEALAEGRSPASSTAELRAVLFETDDRVGEMLNVFAAFLFSRNAGIGMLAFALGFALGVPVVLLMFYNGLILGALAAVYEMHGLSAEFWAWIAIHGTTELTAVILCGGAGFVLATSLAFPGPNTRLATLARQGRMAARIVIGAVVLFLVAALLEGFARQLVTDSVWRAAIAVVALGFWVAYFVRAGSGERLATAHSLRARVGLARPRRRRDIVTPESVALPVDLADRGERAAAVLIDLLIIVAALVGLWLALWAVLRGGDIAQPSGWGLAFALVASFALRSFYFTLFELRWQGRTPGKRLLGLRVIDRRGGRLRSDAVFARNLMREVELFLPISVLIGGGPGGWATLLTLVWVFVFVLLPFFNKDRMRAGDIVGGTWVIAAPKSLLLRDVAAGPASASPFTREQLDVYGIYELQTLEDVLRQGGLHGRQAQDAVARRIQAKIGWAADPGLPGSRAFLETFYAALRGHLEAKMLLGVRREDKHHSL